MNSTMHQVDFRYARLAVRALKPLVSPEEDA
jgi:hypothetical protein